MAVSQNGWDLVTIGELDRTPIPGTSVVPVPGVLRGDVATILHWVGVQFNSRVEKLYNPGCWGWNSPTPIPGTNIYSNHCSGTAVDFNAPSFPWKLYTMTPAQRQACREIVAQTEGVVVWGGDFPTFVDEMHFEIDATDAEVARIANKLKGEDMPTDEQITKVLRAAYRNPNYQPTAEELRRYKQPDWGWPKLSEDLAASLNPTDKNITDALRIAKNDPKYNPTADELARYKKIDWGWPKLLIDTLASKSEYAPVEEPLYRKKG